jgi:ribosomal protein L40E
MVAARPFFIGSPGCVRSSAFTWLSSQQSTKACSGGARRSRPGADTQLCGHGAGAPVRGCSGLALRGQLYEARRVDRARRRTTRQIMIDALQNRLKVALASSRGLDAANVQRHSNVSVCKPCAASGTMRARDQRNCHGKCPEDCGRATGHIRRSSASTSEVAAAA